MMIILFLLPLIIHIISSTICIFWLDIGVFGMIELITDSIIIPLYFTLVIEQTMVKCVDACGLLKLVVSFFIAFIINMLCISISFVSWGVSTGYLLNPDSETVLIYKYEIFAVSIILLLGLVVVCLRKCKATK